MNSRTRRMPAVVRLARRGSRAIEKALGKLDGVVEAKASSSEQKVLVRYEPGKVTFQQMIEAVNSTGYKASLPDAS